MHTEPRKKLTLFQTPNLPLIVGGVATVLSWVLPYGQLNFTAALVAFGALFTWAWLELFQGVNMIRRGLGLAVLIWLIVSKLS
jgi:hypothetical protein